MTEQSKEEFKENIQGWIDNRFGVPNTVNIQCFLDFSEWLIKETGYVQLAALQTALKQSQAGEEIDLPEDWYELFCAIQNSGIAKIKADVLEILNKEITDQYPYPKQLDEIEAYFTEKK